VLLRELMNRKGTYVAVLPSASTQALMNEWAQEHGIPILDDLHCTLLYSRKVIPVVNSTTEYTAKPLGFIQMDDECVAIELDCPSMVARHEQFISQGGTHDFDPFILHMTILKDHKIDPKDIPPIKFRLMFEREYNEELNLE
jgi:hypothetical protein